MKFTQYNANPDGNNVGDCTVRAISTVLGQDWDRTYIEMCLQGFIMKNMPSGNHVWGAYLKTKGFRREVLPNECPDCYTVRDFCRDHPTAAYLVQPPTAVNFPTNGCGTVQFGASGCCGNGYGSF